MNIGTIIAIATPVVLGVVILFLVRSLQSKKEEIAALKREKQSLEYLVEQKEKNLQQYKEVVSALRKAEKKDKPDKVPAEPAGDSGARLDRLNNGGV